MLERQNDLHCTISATDVRDNGTQVVCRYVDLVSNGDMSLYIVRFDATQDEMAIEHHKFV